MVLRLKNLKNKVIEPGAKERYYTATQWQLMWRKFMKHRLAVYSMVFLILMYFVAVVYEFLAPYDMTEIDVDFLTASPTRIHFFDKKGNFRRPFVYGFESELDLETYKWVSIEDTLSIYPIYFFKKGDTYKFWNLFPADIHLFGVDDPGKLFLFGTDKLGRDLFSRILAGSRISLSIGLIGVFMSFVLGSILGGISGSFGGMTDTIIQRVIEFLISIPTIPLWMALSAAVPETWSPIKVYFAITIILSIFGWAGLARVVRGKMLELREEDFALAAKVSGNSDIRAIVRHLLPNFMSYLIVHVTLAVPQMILAETALSFLQLGIRPPAVSWGTLMQDAQNVRSVAIHLWLLIPGVFVIITVLLFNFLGDGLRDAADPYK